ncbi:MAG: hypothetical protein ACTSWN_10910, partial [Promethearchaeota archaeon]
ILGVSGLIDKLIFYDRELEKKIKNAWISKLIGENNREKKRNRSKRGKSWIKKEMLTNGGKKLIINCPECKSQKIIEFSSSEVEKRKNNPAGIVCMRLPSGDVCRHKLILYVDRHFDLIAIETAEISQKQ